MSVGAVDPISPLPHLALYKFKLVFSTGRNCEERCGRNFLGESGVVRLILLSGGSQPRTHIVMHQSMDADMAE